MKRILLLLIFLGALRSSLPADEPATPGSFAYILQADSFARAKAGAVSRLAACGRDWIVLDAVFGGGIPWERADLDAIRRGRPARKVIAYISIGEAEDYRPYWHKEWVNKGKLTPAAPAWLGAENPEWKGNFRVKYWAADWQRLILDAMDSALASGFDGVYLDIVDGFQTFEQQGQDYIDNRVNSETNQTYRRDMVDWVKTIAAHVRATNPATLVIPQNGSQLLAHADFLETISAIGIEDLFTNGNKLQDKSDTAEVLGNLKIMAGTKKPVLLVEYPKNADRQALSKRRAKENGFVWLITDRQLKTLGESGK